MANVLVKIGMNRLSLSRRQRLILPVEKRLCFIERLLILSEIQGVRMNNLLRSRD